MIIFFLNLSKELEQNNKQNCMHGSMVCVRGYAQTTPDVTKNEWEYGCVQVSVYAHVCVSLDKTVNPQATRTQYPVCLFLISCLSLVEWEAVERGWQGTAGPVAPETGDTAGRSEKSLRRSPYLSVSAATPYSLFFLSLSSFIISDLIKPSRAACSAMKHLLAVCYKIVVGEERWWDLISHYAKPVTASLGPLTHMHAPSKMCTCTSMYAYLQLSDTPILAGVT